VLTIKGLVDDIKAEDSPFANEIKALLEEIKALKVEEERKIYEDLKKKKKGKGVEDFDPEKVVPRLEDKDVAKIVKRRISMADCLNKGYIIDGVLKTQGQLQAVFQDENGELIESILPNSVFSIEATEEEVK
jgi:transcription antitermination factor NusG